MAEATSDDTPQPSSHDTPHELSPDNMIRLLRHVMAELSVTQQAKSRDLITELRAVVQDFSAISQTQLQHSREMDKAREEMAVQLIHLKDIDQRLEAGFQHSVSAMVDALKPMLQERLDRIQRETHQGMADLHQHAYALRQAGKRLPWKFTSAIVVALLVALVGIWVSIGYNVWRENRHLKADLVRLSRFEALVYGLDRYLLETHYRTLSPEAREQIDTIYRDAGHLPPDAKKRRAAQANRAGL
jgi:hypothetical protein